MNNYSFFGYHPLSRVIIVTGHYGSGKTNVALNLAYALRERGEKVTVVDFDIVNPYFRAADDIKTMEKLGITAVIPEYANTNVDVPSLPPDIFAVFESDGYVIFDVGGDDDGAAALGMYRAYFQRKGYELLYVINKYRPLTEQSSDALELLRDIERSSRLKCTAIVNNSNIGEATEKASLYDSQYFARKISGDSGLPIAFSASFEREDLKKPDGELLIMKNVTKRAWDAGGE